MRWDISITEELPTARGTYSLAEGKPPSAYLKGTSEGQLTLAGRSEKRIRIAVADLEPLTVYRVRASAVDMPYVVWTLGSHNTLGDRFGAGIASRCAFCRCWHDGLFEHPAYRSRGQGTVFFGGTTLFLGGTRVRLTCCPR